MYRKKVSAFKRTAPVNPCSLIVGHFFQCFGSQLGIGMEFWYFNGASQVAFASQLKERWHCHCPLMVQ
jgi:hypothetical protein